MEWLNEPPQWQVDGDIVRVATGAKTDSWRKTHDGGIRDSGHFYFQPVTGDFEATVTVRGKYADLYDQAGLMVRVDQTTWIKCGIEYFQGLQHASAVVTRDYSDWSLNRLQGSPPAIDLRVVRHGSTFAVYYTLPDYPNCMIRQAFLTEDSTVSVGIMCAAPTGNGFEIEFEGFAVRPS
jgi:regulation of enolase protein 1 (concanavalin A-like superfamily)